MRLDLPTLFLTTVVVTFVVGVLFLLSWSQARQARALAIWGSAHLLGSGASALLCLRGAIPDSLSIGLANAAMLAGYGLIWSGVRAFERRPPLFAVVAAGSTAWALACLIPAFFATIEHRVAFASTVVGAFCALSVGELWRGRAEPLASRPTAIALMSAYALLYWIRVPLAYLAAPMPAPALMSSPWIPVLCFAGTLFAVATAFTFMALTKERAELEQRRAAQTDPLTGLANRRAFVEGAEARLAARSGGVALIVFDLDHFKAINDTYGHAVGDGVLVGFAHAARAVLPREALIGRMGGEEFACLLPGAADGAAAWAAERAAERVRATLARIALATFPGLAIRASVGLAVAERGRDETFDELFRRADDALYAAKRGGRDRVVTAGEPLRHAA